MSTQVPLVQELRSKRSQILEIIKKYGGSDPQVFGSVARCEESHNSDIDILVTLPKGYDIFEQRLSMVEELERLLKRKVDLIVKSEVNSFLRAIIFAEAQDL